ncbi:MAG: zf-HC2 domain-containing protein [Candidatus Desantisbacteria bacterium]
MNCKKIQELLLTDYLDGELNTMILDRIEQHMDSCIHCRQFEQEIQIVRLPFEKVRYIEPPTRVWEGVREKIVAEQLLLQDSLFACLVERLREFLFIYRQPIFATTTISLAVVAFALIFIHMPEQTDLLNVVAEDFGFVVTTENDAICDFGTDIEKYFL